MILVEGILRLLNLDMRGLCVLFRDTNKKTVNKMYVKVLSDSQNKMCFM